MNYSEAQIRGLNAQCRRQSAALLDLNFEGLRQSNAQAENVRDYLRHGVGRRLGVIQRCLERIFALFPPEQERPLPHDTLSDVQICLHAFVINVSGVLDTWAWAFVLRHDLLRQIGDPRRVGLFKTATQKFLPGALRDYVNAQMTDWQDKYLRGYRDALAHRIPLYIPPAAFTKKDATRHEELEQLKAEYIRTGQWDCLDAAWAEQDALGTAYPFFMHEFSETEAARPVVLHPQIISDSMTIVEFGRRYYAAWHEREAIQQ